MNEVSDCHYRFSANRHEALVVGGHGLLFERAHEVVGFGQEDEKGAGIAAQGFLIEGKIGGGEIGRAHV